LSDLSQQNNESNVIAENTDVHLDWSSSNRSQGIITAPALQKNLLLPLVRKKKILKIRKQLAEGTYDINKRLNAVLDCLLEDLVA
jgi:hypothetical protein